MYLATIALSALLVQCEINDYIGSGSDQEPSQCKIDDDRVQKNLVVDYGADGTDQENDSKQLQQAIDEVSAIDGGGIIFIPQGQYYLSEISLKSNVHLSFEDGTIIKPIGRENNKNYSVFYLGVNSGVVKNVKITGSCGKFTVDLREVENTNVRVIQCGNVDGFVLSDFGVLDQLTKFSAITFGLASYDGKYFGPHNGTVKNISAFSTHYGYGLVQAQVAKNVEFKNLYSEGGVTLRLETGENKFNELQPEGLGIFDIKAKNIIGENGNSAVMISPHTIKNGHVDIKNVVANNCGFAVRIDKGFANKSQSELGISPGYFKNPTISNVNATYGTTSQLKWKHWDKYLDCDSRALLTPNPDEFTGNLGKEIFIGPSITPILYDASGEGPGHYEATISRVTKKGFGPTQKSIITENDKVNCTP
ncbi:glycoside hydrolase family 55 protein [Zobellia galactanivorans]|uniref:glycoside hydrolase family 55 protein n=1 Tax=Zobellia galactanivorans (strain DSM 12802 / CCUG 47099 / CIP 106680 / NCIMB 13871 / Dsij) TaxID=63186 RepID=UPI001C065904|nr:glycoside hydrolase family 55 protein [Zobellia galactanivorans]MBU3025899.1 glycoside hydrolase family 55 protein [Zobellia galactanivorans]